jgi:hypothetical protein
MNFINSSHQNDFLENFDDINQVVEHDVTGDLGMINVRQYLHLVGDLQISCEDLITRFSELKGIVIDLSIVEKHYDYLSSLPNLSDEDLKTYTEMYRQGSRMSSFLGNITRFFHPSEIFPVCAVLLGSNISYDGLGTFFVEEDQEIDPIESLAQSPVVKEKNYDQEGVYKTRAVSLWIDSMRKLKKIQLSPSVFELLPRTLVNSGYTSADFDQSQLTWSEIHELEFPSSLAIGTQLMDGIDAFEERLRANDSISSLVAVSNCFQPVLPVDFQLDVSELLVSYFDRVVIYFGSCKPPEDLGENFSFFKESKYDLENTVLQIQDLCNRPELENAVIVVSTNLSFKKVNGSTPSLIEFLDRLDFVPFPIYLCGSTVNLFNHSQKSRSFMISYAKILSYTSDVILLQLTYSSAGVRLSNPVIRNKIFARYIILGYCRLLVFMKMAQEPSHVRSLTNGDVRSHFLEFCSVNDVPGFTKIRPSPLSDKISEKLGSVEEYGVPAGFDLFNEGFDEHYDSDEQVSVDDSNSTFDVV